MFALWIGVALAGWTDPTHPDAGEVFNRGIESLDAADPSAAEAAFREAAALDSEWGRPRLGLGLSLLRQNRASEAIRVLAPLAEDFPEQSMVWTHLSQAKFAARDFPGAQEAAERGLALEPADVLCVSAMVDVQLRTGALDAAIAVLEAAAAASPSPDWSCLRVRVAIEQGALDTLDALLASCDGGDAALVRNAWGAASTARGKPVTVDIGAAGHMVTQANQAIMLLQQGLVEEAAALADRLIAAHPDDVRVHIVRGRIAYVAGDTSTAVRHFEEAFEREDWVEVHGDGVRTGILTQSQEQEWVAMSVGAAATLAGVYAETERVPQAHTLLQRAEDRFGPHAALHAAAAWAEMYSGRPAEAWDRLARALADPQPGVVDTLASELLFQHADSLPDAMAELLVGIEGHPGVLLNAAVGLTNQGRGALALPLVDKVWQQVRDRSLAVGIGYTAAVQERDLAAAEVWHDRAIAVDAVDPVTVRNHTAILLDADRHDAVLSLLGQHPGVPDGPTFRVVALVELERTEGLEAAALADGVDPAARFNAAVTFGNGGDTDAAVRVLEQTCPLMQGGNRVSCEEALAAWTE